MISSDNVTPVKRGELMIGGPASRFRILLVDIVILLLQLTMLAITATTTPKTSERGTTMTVARIVASIELDRAERGETEEEETVPEGGSEEMGMTIRDAGFEHVVVSVGVVETIKSLWDDTTPLVRRFR